MTFTSYVYHLYKKISQNIFLLFAVFFIVPGISYAQDGEPELSLPDRWGSNQTCRFIPNNNIRISSVDFTAGGHTDRFFTLQPRYREISSWYEKEEKRKSATLDEYGDEYGTFAFAVFSYDTPPSGDRSKGFEFNLSDIAPFIVDFGYVYRNNGSYNESTNVYSHEPMLKIKHGPLPNQPQLFDRLLYANGMLKKHKRQIGHREWLPRHPDVISYEWGFSTWEPYSMVSADSVFLLNEGACLVHYIPDNPSQIRHDGKVLLDGKWVQGHRDSENKWRFVFLALFTSE
ncbi:MAG: hypothetical protein OXC40_07455 [Proteobacteria bacterium]|nr:hypothetical protein [Pseudomonadota bacterium]